ncbi:MAG: 30S ribosome-binding factor RbfA [Gammaproteobacteria bacterium]|nr:MAG: 30S ribosome-binding factor RbfA [Gammaproteobacteria bacterium]
MPREFSRTRRVEEQLRRELAELIRTHIKEPDLAMFSLAEIRVSSDLSHARIYVTFLEDDPEIIQRSLDILEHASGRLRGLLGKRMRIRMVPQLEFKYDDLIQQGTALSNLIEKAVAEDNEKADRHGSEIVRSDHDGNDGDSNG